MSDETLGGPVSGSFVPEARSGQAHESPAAAESDGPAQSKPKHNRSHGAPRDRTAKLTGPALAQAVATMSAQRMGLKKIAAAVQRDWRTVRTLLGQTETQKMIADYRDFLRGQALSEALEIQTDGFKWVKETMAARESKEFDNVTRGMSNLERIYASAAGENGKVQVAQINMPPEGVHSEIKSLLEALMPKKP